MFTNEPQGPTPTLEGMKMPEEEIKEIKVTQDDVQKILQELKTDKVQGPDWMHPYFLKETSKEVALPLSIIFTKTLESAQVPDEWKKGRITALFKKGSKRMAINYCPVSLTSIVCKCM